MEDFVKKLREVMKERSKEPDFADRYNNKRKTRTELMLGSGESREKSIIYQTLEKYYTEKLTVTVNVAFERYCDCIKYGGVEKGKEWYDGKIYNDVLIEVENEIKEFKGTFLDLLRIQGHKKIAIFYFDEPLDLEQKKEDLKAVYKYFTGNGFSEAKDTEYLIMFLPNKYDAAFFETWASIHLKTNKLKGL